MISRADLIDDNVGLLNDIPMVIGNDSSKGIADTFFSTRKGTSATTGFFTEGNNNLLKDVLDFNGLTSAVTLMRTQKDLDARIVGIQPSVLMVHPALEATTRCQLANGWYLWSVPLHGAVLVALLGGRLGPVVETSPDS